MRQNLANNCSSGRISLCVSQAESSPGVVTRSHSSPAKVGHIRVTALPVMSASQIWRSFECFKCQKIGSATASKKFSHLGMTSIIHSPLIHSDSLLVSQLPRPESAVHWSTQSTPHWSNLNTDFVGHASHQIFPFYLSPCCLLDPSTYKDIPMIVLKKLAHVRCHLL